MLNWFKKKPVDNQLKKYHDITDRIMEYQDKINYYNQQIALLTAQAEEVQKESYEKLG